MTRVCNYCGQRGDATPWVGLGGVAMWTLNCDQCGTETQGYRRESETETGEAYATGVGYGEE